MIRRILFIFLFSLFFFSSFSNTVNANEYQNAVVVINQVRGTECCDKGSLSRLQKQVKALKEDSLKGNFALRYDVLGNKNFVGLLKNLDSKSFELGAFLEITPQLTKDAGVEYKGSEQDWYKAQHVYTVGYSIEDRKKLVDTYMKKFLTVFSYYPKFSTAWLMDTATVNYTHDNYGVVAHQITREQWGTDSYTLSGGSIHYPYFANKNWLFTPAVDEGILVLRQTGADPLHNYGDTTNSFTTQPNDYALGKRDINYFNALKNQFFNQKQNSFGFLLLGLENSMDDKYQDEFAKQLKNTKDSGATSFLVNEFVEFYKTKKEDIVGLVGKDLAGSSEDKAYWITTPNYRVRLLYKNNSLYLSDLRIFSSSLKDPYNTYIAKDLAYWVTPFIFNASQLYTKQPIKELEYKDNFKAKVLDNLRKKYLPEFSSENFEMKSSSNDLTTFFEGIELLDQIENVSDFTRDSENNLRLKIITKDSKTKEIIFSKNTFNTNFKAKKINTNKSWFIKTDKNKDSYTLSFTNLFSLKINCVNDSCSFEFEQPTNEGFIKLREDFYPYFFPEKIPRKLNQEKSVFYAHNRYAIADKNPARLVFIPKDAHGFAVGFNKEPQVTTILKVKKTMVRTPKSNGTTFVDVISNEVGKYVVEFKLGDDFVKEETIFFAPNCKERLVYCVLHPVELKWYLSSMFVTKLRGK